MALNIVLFEPEIPANTGNIGRTCVATGTRLHLIEPLGFRLNEKSIKRAGMDYWEHLDVTRYINFEDFLEKNPGAKIYMATTKGQHVYSDVNYEPDILILLAPSVYNPTQERLLNRAKKYQEDENTNIYAYKDHGKHKGIVIFKIAINSATILDIAVKPDYQGQGIGSKLIDFIFNSFNVNNITAETDDDAIGFYKKYGFTVADTKVNFDVKRYSIIKERTK